MMLERNTVLYLRYLSGCFTKPKQTRLERARNLSQLVQGWINPVISLRVNNGEFLVHR